MSIANNSSSIPVRPLPQNALEAVNDSLTRRGFKGQSLQYDYPFSDREGRLVKPNLLAFAHETSRGPDYTGLTVFNPANGISDEQLVQTLAQSGAPFHLIHRHQTERYSFWFTNARKRDAQTIDAQRIETDISYSQLNQVFEGFAADIQPQRIIDVKQGRDSFIHFADAGPVQLALWAVDVTGKGLVERFGRAVQSLRENMVLDAYIHIPDISTQLLGATILAHTGALGREYKDSDQPLNSLINKAFERFPNYFTRPLFEHWYQATSGAYSILTELRYANFSPELLTQLYREAFPDKDQRRALGRYDTPLYLTRRIWEALPIEFLPPEKRILADMTCGWGSFLISGHERLSRMSDMGGRSLRDYIYGNDKEPFTAKLAGLGLLVSTLQDSWNIDNRDAMEWEQLNEHPNIIVGNPPFRELREEGNRGQVASIFLKHAVKSLDSDGYLGMIMPKSFIKGEGISFEARKELLENCDIQEIWDLPEGIFEGGGAETVVVFAQKHNAIKLKSFPVRTRILERKTLPAYIEKGLFTTSGLVINQEDWKVQRRSKSSKITHLINYKKLLSESEWNNIRSKCRELAQVAYITNGAIVGNNPKNKRWANEPSVEVKWLSHIPGNLDQSYNLTYKDVSKILYPSELEEPRKSKKLTNNPDKDSEHIFKSSKVLLVAKPNMGWGNRATVAIDRKGYYVSNAFYAFRPRELYSIYSNEVLAAIVGWYVSNAWIVENLTYRQIPSPTVKKIPVPNLEGEQIKTLENAVIAIENAFNKGEKPSQNENDKIDAVLQRAYELSDSTFERLKLLANWRRSSRITLENTNWEENPNWKISGVVDHVDAEKGKITFWFDGFDELQTVPIVPVMPGWLLRSEVAFRTSIPRSCVNQLTLANNTSWGFFYPQDYAYLDEDEAFAELLETLS